MKEEQKLKENHAASDVRCSEVLGVRPFNVIVFRESLVQSIFADITTLGMLCFCIWFSEGYKFWNFVCFVMLIFFVFGKALSKRGKMFRTKSELLKYVEGLPNQKSVSLKNEVAT